MQHLIQFSGETLPWALRGRCTCWSIVGPVTPTPTCHGPDPATDGTRTLACSHLTALRQPESNVTW